jgi:hypothetical protein
VEAVLEKVDEAEWPKVDMRRKRRRSVVVGAVEVLVGGGGRQESRHS